MWTGCRTSHSKRSPCATPVVATRAGGLPQAIENGVTGRLVSERSAVELAQAIRDLLQHPGDAQRLGTAARAHVDAHFGWARTAERLEAAYENAVVLASPST